jgi:hypothetical protein
MLRDGEIVLANRGRFEIACRPPFYFYAFGLRVAFDCRFVFGIGFLGVLPEFLVGVKD